MSQGLYRTQLPAVLASDPGFVDFVRIFEDVGTPLYEAPDGFSGLFDPRTSPSDLARYLGSWLGLAVDESLPADRQRDVTTAVASHFGTRGTKAALEALLNAVTGGSVTVVDPGCVQRQGIDEPEETPVPLVEVHVTDTGGVPVERLDGLLRGELPAWIPFRIVLDGDPSEERPA